jgi:hypothetical protein
MKRSTVSGRDPPNQVFHHLELWEALNCARPSSFACSPSNLGSGILDWPSAIVDPSTWATNRLHVSISQHPDIVMCSRNADSSQTRGSLVCATERSRRQCTETVNTQLLINVCMSAVTVRATIPPLMLCNASNNNRQYPRSSCVGRTSHSAVRFKQGQAGFYFPQVVHWTLAA